MKLRIGSTLTVIAVIGVAAGCSSSSKPASPATTTSTSVGTTSTTASTKPGQAPSPSTVAAVQAFFAGRGAPLLAFERVSAPLATGVPPDRATCERFQRETTPALKGMKTAFDLVTLSDRIPDKPLADAFHRDVYYKVGLVTVCTSPHGLPTGDAAAPTVYPAIRTASTTLRKLLSAYNISI